MKNLAMDPVFHEYAALVIHKLQSDEIPSLHQDYAAIPH